MSLPSRYPALCVYDFDYLRTCGPRPDSVLVVYAQQTLDQHQARFAFAKWRACPATTRPFRVIMKRVQVDLGAKAEYCVVMAQYDLSNNEVVN